LYRVYLTINMILTHNWLCSCNNVSDKLLKQ
jgi:hypothetical protein